MRSINVNFDNDDYDLLVEAKGDLSWREFVMTLVTSKKAKK